MYVGITETQKPIFQEDLTGFSPPKGYSTDNMTYVIYQFHSKTLFSQSVYKRVEGVYFAGSVNGEIPRKIWTKEMIDHSAMREKTVQREPKSVRYTIFGKALFTLLLVLILVFGFLAAQSIYEMKKAKKQTMINLSNKNQ